MRRTSIIKITVFIVIATTISGYTQTKLNQEDVEFYISNLSKVDDIHSWEIDYFIENRIVEAVPNLEQYFWQQNCDNKRYFLEGLYFLGSSLTHQYALALFDSLSVTEKEFYDPAEKYNSIDCGDLLREKVFCIQILYRLGDYSKTDEVFELIEREKEQGSSEIAGINLLPFIIKYRPDSVSYTHLRAHETVLDLVCRLLLEKKNKIYKTPHSLIYFLLLTNAILSQLMYDISQLLHST